MNNLNQNSFICTKKILFLGYGKEKTKIISELKKYNCKVKQKSTKVVLSDLDDIDLVISYGYRHILKSSFINHKDIPIINLHISYLPWNRGAHPNFWSFYDKTPIGITIHLVDEGLDTGPIIFQEIIKLDDKENTFEESYAMLNKELENLFLKNIGVIIKGKFTTNPQKSKGTYHKSSDLPKNFRGWEYNIAEEINYLHELNKK